MHSEPSAPLNTAFGDRRAGVPGAQTLTGPGGRRPGNRVLTRRTVLIGTGAVAGAVALAGCVDDQPSTPPLDPLLSQVTRARADAAIATASAAALPGLAGVLGTIATERTQHADAISTEITRVSGQQTTAATPTSDSPAPETLSAAELQTRLTESAKLARDATLTQWGYRAGLLGSVSAACTVQATFLLK